MVLMASRSKAYEASVARATGSNLEKKLDYIIIVHMGQGMWEAAPIAKNFFSTREAALRRMVLAKETGEAEGVATKVVRSDFFER